jgi:hypothetical protein
LCARSRAPWPCVLTLSAGRRARLRSSLNKQAKEQAGTAPFRQGEPSRPEPPGRGTQHNCPGRGMFPRRRGPVVAVAIAALENLWT